MRAFLMIETIFGSEAAFLDWSGFIFGILGVLPVVFGFGGWVLWKTRRRYDVLGAEFEDLDQRYARYRDARQKEIEALKANLEKVKMLELRLDQTDPERFIDRANELYDAGDFDGAEKVSLEFTSKQSEAFGLAAEILAEQRLLDSETEGQWAADDAQKFAAIGRAANPESKRLGELEKLTKARVDGIARNEPIEALHMDGMSDVELNRLSQALSKQGRYQLALIAAKRSVPIAKTRTGGLSSNYAGAIAHYASCLKEVGELKIAQELYREALAIDADIIGTSHPTYATRLNNLATVLEAQGNCAEAEALYREALAIGEDGLGEDHPTSKIFFDNRDDLLAKMA
jgi:tetratricopeptide (TPR) repeat protein